MPKTSLLKPRNPLVTAAKFRKAGVHGKSNKAKRSAERRELNSLFKSRDFSCSFALGVTHGTND